MEHVNGMRLASRSWPRDAHGLQGRQWWTLCLCTAYVGAPLRRGAAWEACRPLAAPRCESGSVCTNFLQNKHTVHPAAYSPVLKIPVLEIPMPITSEG